MTNGSENSKKKCLLHVNPIFIVWVLSNGVEDTS